MEQSINPMNDYYEQMQISGLLIQYFSAIYDKRIEPSIIENTFTIDARILRSNGSALVGHKNILDLLKKSFERFKATHHVTTDYIVDINDDTAIIRNNLTAMHVWSDNEDNSSLNNKHFLAGAIILSKAIRINNNWRISELVNKNVWRTGDGMSEMAHYERPD